MNKAPKLIEENIVLRQAIESDIISRLEFGIQSEYAKMIGINLKEVDGYSDADAVIWYERLKAHPCKWIIEYEKKFVGVVSLRPYTEDHKAKFAIEIYDRKNYGKGIGTRVTKMVLKYAFEDIGYHKVFLRVLDFNERAISCYKKCGFIQEGIDREGALIDEEYCSDIYMGILNSEYKSRKNSVSSDDAI